MVKATKLISWLLLHPNRTDFGVHVRINPCLIHVFYIKDFKVKIRSESIISLLTF